MKLRCSLQVVPLGGTLLHVGHGVAQLLVLASHRLLRLGQLRLYCLQPLPYLPQGLGCLQPGPAQHGLLGRQTGLNINPSCQE